MRENVNCECRLLVNYVLKCTFICYYVATNKTSVTCFDVLCSVWVRIWHFTHTNVLKDIVVTNFTSKICAKFSCDVWVLHGRIFKNTILDASHIISSISQLLPDTSGGFSQVKTQDCSPHCNSFITYHRELIHQSIQCEPHSWNLSSIPVTCCRMQFWCFSQSLRRDVTIKHDVTTRSANYRLDLLRTCLSDVLCSFLKFLIK
jgi:hypothetical protein